MHKTKLGEYFVKKIIAAALYIGVCEIYVTIYKKHTGLITLLQRYGFTEYGTKGEGDEPELVFTKSMTSYTGDILLDYPFVHAKDVRKFILSVKPEYHTPLFPDSIQKKGVRMCSLKMLHIQIVSIRYMYQV